MQTVYFRAMGCQMMAALDSDSSAARHALASVPSWFEEWEDCLSRFRETSALTRLNLGAGQPVQVSEVLWEVVRLALKGCEWTDGLVSPTMLDALESVGYDRSFDALQVASSGATRSKASRAQVATRVPALDDWRAVELDATGLSIHLPVGMRLDLGGVAKGWAADQAATRLAEFGPALVDAGGDVAVSGPTAEGAPWPIGVTDPTSHAQPLELLLLAGGGVATSGRDYRRWIHAGMVQHHIIDPRTGLPAETDVLSSTVIASSAGQAEIAAKAAFIMGSLNGTAWLEEHELPGLLVLEDGRVMRTARLQAYTWS